LHYRYRRGCDEEVTAGYAPGGFRKVDPACTIGTGEVAVTGYLPGAHRGVPGVVPRTSTAGSCEAAAGGEQARALPVLAKLRCQPGAHLGFPEGRPGLHYRYWRG
jgi:hypothetical protein